MSFWTLHGQPADRRTIQLHQGPGHCGWETATILSVPNPLGQVLTAANSLTYLRDPNGVLVGVAGAAPFGPSVSPPEDAVFTGYRWGPMELWVSPEAGLESVLLRRDGIWERWPRAMKEFGCM